MWSDDTPCFASNVCRICANACDVLLPLFGKGDEKERIDLKIKKCLPIVVREEDCKPKQVCYPCISKLEVCMELVELSLNAEFKFESILQSKFPPLLKGYVQENSNENLVSESSKNESLVDGALVSLPLPGPPAPRPTRAWPDDLSKTDHNNGGSLATTNDASVIVLSKMDAVADPSAQHPREDGQIPQDIVFMVELKYKDSDQATLTKAHTVSYTVEPQDSVKHFSLDTNKLHPVNVNYLGELQPVPTSKSHPVSYAVEPQSKAYTLTYSTDAQGMNTSKPIMYTTDTDAITIQRPITYVSEVSADSLSKTTNLQFTQDGKSHMLVYTADLQPIALTKVTFAEEDNNINKDARAVYTEINQDLTVINAVADQSDMSLKSSTLDISGADNNVGLDENIDETMLLGPPRNREENGATNDSQVKKDKKFHCTICDKSFMRRTNLNAHMGVHTQVKPHCCYKCGKRFVLRWDLTLHMRIHSGTYTCEFCSKAFTVQGKLERHRRTHTGERPFVCNTCGKAFGDKRNLEAHDRIHSGERPFTCTTCGRSFRARSHLIDHTRVHSQEAAYKCDICNKSFKWKTNLNIHLKVHTGERFPCEGCGREFARRADLTRHQRTHMDEREHVCGMCSKCYSDKAMLQKHLKSHSEHKPHMCDVCGKSFHFQWYLSSHKKTHLEEKHFPCNQCDRVFSKKANLLTHCKSHAVGTEGEF